MSNCNQTSDRIVDYLDDTLSPSLRVGFEEHVEVCKECREQVESFRAILVGYRGSAGVQAPDSLASELLSVAGRPLSKRQRGRSPLLLAVAALVVVSASVWAMLELVSEPPATESTLAPGGDPVLASEWMATGDRHYAEGRLQLALSDYEEATLLVDETQAEAPLIHHRLATTLADLGEFARALEHLAIVIDRYPHYPYRAEVLDRMEQLPLEGLAGSLSADEFSALSELGYHE